MFVYWNPNGRYVPSPFEDRKEGEEIISDRETLYRSIFESTEDNSLSSTDCIVIAAFKAMTTGRLALAYYSETPGNDFVAKLEKWKESFTGAKWIPSIYMVSKYAYGSERNERIEIESGIYTKKIEELLWCKLYGHPISCLLYTSGVNSKKKVLNLHLGEESTEIKFDITNPQTVLDYIKKEINWE